MNKILNIIDRIILILASVIFIILIGCISILPIAKSKSYYLKEQDRNKVEEILEKYTFLSVVMSKKCFTPSQLNCKLSVWVCSPTL